MKLNLDSERHKGRSRSEAKEQGLVPGEGERRKVSTMPPLRLGPLRTELGLPLILGPLRTELGLPAQTGAPEDICTDHMADHAMIM